MKVLHFLRHAKSDWGDPALADHARPLNKRGIAAAEAVGRRLAEDAFQVDHIACSTAARARETLSRLGAYFRRVPTSFHDELYMVSPEEVLALVHTLPETAQSVLLVGHNPTTHDLALALTARAAPGQGEALAQLKQKYPTGALCTLSFAAAQWRELAPGGGTLVRFLKPRDLTDGTAKTRPTAKKRAAKKRAAKKRAAKKQAAKKQAANKKPATRSPRR